MCVAAHCDDMRMLHKQEPIRNQTLLAFRNELFLNVGRLSPLQQAEIFDFQLGKVQIMH